MTQDITPRNARDESEIFCDLEKLCNSSGFIHVIAYLSWRDNFFSFSAEQITDDDIAKQNSGKQLIRTEISTLIGLMAKADISINRPAPETLQNYIDQAELLLHEMHMCLQKPWFDAFAELTAAQIDTPRKSPSSTAAGLREPIFYSDESAYNFQYLDLAPRKYSADEDWLNSNVGFSVEEACVVARALSEIQMTKFSDFGKNMLALHPDEWSFLHPFVFDLSELEKATSLTPEKIKDVVHAFTSIQSSANKSFSSLSEFNETNAAPILEVANGSFVLLQIYSLLEAIYEAPFFWMLKDKSYTAKASENRGNFVERFLAQRLADVFGASNVFQNVDIYKGKDRFAEADVLVIYGDRAIVVQAKSKRLTIAARKGNDLQLKDDFKKAIHDAYDQALQCSKALISKDYTFRSAAGDDLAIVSGVVKIFPICALSDHYPALEAQVRQLLTTEVSKKIKSPIVTDIFFLDVLTEILETPLQLLNYLELRAKVHNKLMVNHELTALGYHLKNNLWLDDKFDMIELGSDFTSSIDVAMMVRRAGAVGERTPKGILTRFDGTPIGRLINEFEANPSPELVNLGMFFIQLGSVSARHINNGIDRFTRLSAEDGLVHDFSVPYESEGTGVTVHVSSLPESTARERLSVHCKIRKYKTKSDGWYGLLLAPGTAELRGVLAINEKWEHDEAVEKALEAWPEKPFSPLSVLSRTSLAKKVGRNEKCPCGSGQKYKKCHGV